MCHIILLKNRLVRLMVKIKVSELRALRKQAAVLHRLSEWVGFLQNLNSELSEVCLVPSLSTLPIRVRDRVLPLGLLLRAVMKP